MASRKTATDRPSTPYAPRSPLPRTGLYYAASFRRVPGFAAAHLLGRPRAPVVTTHARACQFVCKVFGVPSPGSCPRLHRALPLFEAMIRRATSCAYGRYLEAHCPFVASVGTPDVPPMDAVMANAVPPKRVFAFVRAVLLAVVPDPLWGTPSTRAEILRRVSWLVNLAHGDVVQMDDVSAETNRACGSTLL